MQGNSLSQLTHVERMKATEKSFFAMVLLLLLLNLVLVLFYHIFLILNMATLGAIECHKNIGCVSLINYELHLMQTTINFKTFKIVFSVFFGDRSTSTLSPTTA